MSRPNRLRGGVTWHSQSSGKSWTMEMLAGALTRGPGLANRTLIIVTDRNDQVPGPLVTGLEFRRTHGHGSNIAPLGANGPASRWETSVASRGNCSRPWIRQSLGEGAAAGGPMEKTMIELEIKGMSCMHCVMLGDRSA